jgi:mono/diheme cytochrome c family protein
MIKKITVLFFLLLPVFILFFSCKHDTLPVLPDLPVVLDTTVCFENDVLPIFQSYCAKADCHDTISATYDFKFNSYENILRHWISPGDASGSRVFQILAHDNSNRMPLPPLNPLTTEQINLIARWINQGAKNTVGCAPTCNSNNFSYSVGVKPILQTHCLGCHGGTAEAGNFILLNTYDEVKQQAVGNVLLQAITHSGTLPPMPQNGARLNDCKIAIIRKWIEAGAPNN